MGYTVLDPSIFISPVISPVFDSPPDVFFEPQEANSKLVARADTRSHDLEFIVIFG
jgi:hypothetical protein